VNKQHLRAAIRRSRRAADMTQLKLALAIGRSPSYIAWFETGRNSPAADEIARMRAAIKAHRSAK
jgi:transcriptional regulator with XRE-family HTH domain